jgi:predicted O-methyltransferase YrrM
MLQNVMHVFEKTLDTGDAGKIRFHYDRDVRSYDYSDEDVRAVAATVQLACEETLGAQWNHYSNALRPEVCSGFAKAIRAVANRSPSIRYLEVGSNQGVSMAFFSEFIKASNHNPVLVSVDPYYEDGYAEGSGAPLHETDLRVSIDKSTKEAAIRLYSRLNAPVRLVEETSRTAMIGMLRSSERYDIIYIDGSHQGLNPLVDAALADCLVDPGGVILLDDWNWEDVQPVKRLFDRTAHKLYECWKIAAYTR